MNTNENQCNSTNNVESIISELRKRGLSNGGSLGYHSGLMDAAADLIESQQAQIERLQTMLDTKDDVKTFVEICKSHAYYIDFPKEHRVIDEDDIEHEFKKLIEAKEKDIL